MTPIATSSTPSSEAEAAAPWRRLLLVAAAVLALALAVVAGRVAWFDSYWVFRREPPWLAATGGSNRLLDRQMRRAKTLQLLTRSYEVALIGSSTVYHGLDPADADGRWRGRVYNAGISGVLADELPIVASMVASRGEARRVVLGLDYYMFSRTDRSVRLDNSLKDPIGRANALLGSLIGRYAIADAWLGEVRGASDPGGWTYDGFRVTPPLPPELTRQNDATRRRTTVPFVPETMASLHETLWTLAGRRVDVYLAPVSDAQLRVLSDLGHLDDFGRWREEAARAAAAHGVPFRDLVDLGRPYPFDPDRGSTEAWLDNLHFTPLIGRQVLAAFGLRAEPAGQRPRP